MLRWKGMPLTKKRQMLEQLKQYKGGGGISPYELKKATREMMWRKEKGTQIFSSEAWKLRKKFGK